jgi:uncharacterized Zn-binding protein involved in type VI secretion
MPAAARLGDMHACPKVEPGPVPHVGGAVAAGEATVLIGFQPAARQGDAAACSGPPDTISGGESTVLIGNKPAARQGDPTQHGGAIVLGCPTVEIGSSAQIDALVAASEQGAPLCEQ